MERFLEYIGEDLKTKPFKINITGEDAIVVITRTDEDIWKLTTVLDPKIHNKYETTDSAFERYIFV